MKSMKKVVGLISILLISFLVTGCKPKVHYYDISSNGISSNKPSSETKLFQIHKLSGTYTSDNEIYIIDFKNNGSLRWRESTIIGEYFFEGTYEYENGEFVLFVKGGDFAMDTIFHAVPQKDSSLLINGGSVYNEYFRKNK